MVDKKLSPPCARPKAEITVKASSAKGAAIYTRVSCGDQHPETQVYDLHELAEQRRYEIVREYSDTISGAKSKRPGLDQMPVGIALMSYLSPLSTELREMCGIF
jgi:predicted site-specific integrase-resolvase